MVFTARVEKSVLTQVTVSGLFYYFKHIIGYLKNKVVEKGCFVVGLQDCTNVGLKISVLRDSWKWDKKFDSEGKQRISSNRQNRRIESV